VRGKALPTSLVALALLLCACGGPRPVVVASKNFTEQLILGEIIAQQVEGCAQVPVLRRLNLGGTLLAHQAITSGEVDIYPEYSGTALMSVLKQQPEGTAEDVMRQVRHAYEEQWAVTWLPSLGFENTFAMAVPRALAEEHQLLTLSDAANSNFPWRLGVGYEFEQRPDGLPGLLRVYPLKLNGPPRTMDLGLLYRALEQNQVDMVAASSTDGMLARLGLRVLEDDRQFFPPYEAAVVVNQKALGRHPALFGCLDALSGRISAEAMREMNRQTDEGVSTEELARKFLGESGLAMPLTQRAGQADDRQ